MIKDIKELKHLTTWQLLDYIIFDELSVEVPIVISSGSYTSKQNAVYVYNGERKTRRERSYDNHLFRDYKKDFPDKHDVLNYKFEEIFKLVKNGSLTTYFIDENGNESTLTEYLIQHSGKLNKIKWEHSLAEIDVSKNENELRIRNLYIYFKSFEIVQLLEGANAGYDPQIKKKEVIRLARELSSESKEPMTFPELAKKIKNILSPRFPKGLEEATLRDDLKYIMGSLRLKKTKRGRKPQIWQV